MLLEKGVDLNAQGGKFGNALQAAVISYRYDETVVEMLLEKGANSNAGVETLAVLCKPQPVMAVNRYSRCP